MQELDLFKDQHIPTQEVVTFTLPDGKKCHIVEDPAQPSNVYPNHVGIIRLDDQRRFIVKRNLLKPTRE